MSHTKDHQRELINRQSRVRGMMLGLALGDTLGAARGALPAVGPLRAGVSTQLACFTAEGIIRAEVRGNHKGICYTPGVVLHAYCRWAFLQGIEVEKMRDRWGSHSASWPDGRIAGSPDCRIAKCDTGCAYRADGATALHTRLHQEGTGLSGP